MWKERESIFVQISRHQQAYRGWLMESSLRRALQLGTQAKCWALAQSHTVCPIQQGDRSDGCCRGFSLTATGNRLHNKRITLY